MMGEKTAAKEFSEFCKGNENIKKELAETLKIPLSQVEEFEAGKRESLMNMEDMLRFIGKEGNEKIEIPEDAEIDLNKLNKLGRMLMYNVYKTILKEEGK